MRALALVLLAALGAQAQPLDSLATRPVVPAVAPDTANIAPDTSDVRTSRGAVTRALLAPGLGQVYNRQPLKAPVATALVVGTAVFAVQRQVSYRRIQQATLYAGCRPGGGGDPDSTPDRVEACADVDAFVDEWVEEGSMTFDALRPNRDRRRGQRDVGVLVVALAYAFQAFDAYVAAELADFDVSEDVALRLDTKAEGPGLTLTVRL